MDRWVWFDMDGTIANLYGVDGWLESLRDYDTRPYKEAKDIYNNIELLATIMDLREKGYKIGVISWGSKESNEKFDVAVTIAKKQWLADRLIDTLLDKIIVTAYGVRKADTCRPYGMGILVDDEKQNRDAWDLGGVIDAKKNILRELRALA